MKSYLSPGEMAVAQMLAEMRHRSNRDASVSNGRIGPQSDAQTDLDGIVGEIALAKALNVYPDLSISPRSGGHDLTVGSKKIDVKATRRENGRLLAIVEKKIEDADVYVLAVVAGNRVHFPGYAFASELIRQERIANLGHGPTYAIDQANLRQWA